MTISAVDAVLTQHLEQRETDLVIGCGGDLGPDGLNMYERTTGAGNTAVSEARFRKAKWEDHGRTAGRLDRFDAMRTLRLTLSDLAAIGSDAGRPLGRSLKPSGAVSTGGDVLRVQQPGPFHRLLLQEQAALRPCRYSTSRPQRPHQWFEPLFR